jgi:hypothetical protein
MFIPNSAFIRRDGEMTQDGVYLIDKWSKVYKYFDDFDVAVLVKNVEAFSEHGTSLLFNKKNIVEIEVVEYEDILNMYDLYLTN